MPRPHTTIPRQPAVHVAWLEFERALADALATLGEDEYLIVGFKRRNHFVQFAGEGAFGMRAEAVSNAYLGEDERLSPRDYETLTALGWDPPTHHPGESVSLDRSTNFFVDAAAPVSVATLSSLAVVTLRDVFRVGHPGQLQYTAFTRSGGSIRFPGLRIKRREPPPRPAAAPAPRPAIVPAGPTRVM